jgi:hypothetical protein
MTHRNLLTSRLKRTHSRVFLMTRERKGAHRNLLTSRLKRTHSRVFLMTREHKGAEPGTRARAWTARVTSSALGTYAPIC